MSELEEVVPIAPLSNSGGLHGSSAGKRKALSHASKTKKCVTLIKAATNNEPIHPSLTAMESTQIVKKYFLGLNKQKGWGYLDDETKNLIIKYPKLLRSKCPDTDDDGEEEDLRGFEDITGWSGLTATECLCLFTEMTCCGRDLLCQLVEMGAPVTDTCYQSVLEEFTEPNYLVVLLISGYMPLKGRSNYFLDEAVAFCDGEARYILGGCMQLLHPEQVKVGDQFGFGEITAEMVKNLRNLPKLKAGVTHQKGGSFAEYEKEWLEEQEGKPAKKRKLW